MNKSETKENKTFTAAELGRRFCRLNPQPIRFCRCACRGRGGKLKRLYQSEAEALFVAAERMAECHCDLYVYRCPERNGWHLTKNPRRW